jgi:hypothetical protein
MTKQEEAANVREDRVHQIMTKGRHQARKHLLNVKDREPNARLYCRILSVRPPDRPLDLLNRKRWRYGEAEWWYEVQNDTTWLQDNCEDSITWGDPDEWADAREAMCLDIYGFEVPIWLSK